MRNPYRVGARLSTWVVMLLVALALGAPVTAQAQEEKEKKIPAPETLVLPTKDGVLLACTWYGSIEGKKAVPIILMHGEGGNRKQFDALASKLQGLGFAVISFDMRGHGDSNRMQNNRELPAPERMNRLQWEAVVGFDLQTVKQFLLDKNDNEELNIDALGMVAADMSAILAVNWVLLDYSWTDLPGRRQGKDIKALVLLSPQRSFKGMSLVPRTLLSGPMAVQSVLITNGSQEPGPHADALKIYETLRQTHPEAPAAQKRANEMLFMVEKTTKLQSVALLDPKLSLGVDNMIAAFLKWRLVDRQENFLWASRKPAAGN
ncbi:alpha/beta hydrolase [Lignipirellula cremea]|uniref:Alpha/beta hydrolase family protein n=1 Tax=Lignipirellula cremea TaxID=2528010 RepID=A0A518E1S3_9BACT|nr:alpha/beta fold hydrolase [Lignipirellula cremea]QDU98040.1 Alpha/beta hydrolase family protein [Lignipirellula cremea]